MPIRAKAEPLRAAFLERATKAVEAWSKTLPPSALASAVAEPRDELVVLRAMQQPAAWTSVADEDPLAAARARGIEARQRLLASEGGVTGVEEMAELLDISRQAVDKRRRLGKLLAVSQGKSRWLYPVWQVESGRALPGLEEVLHALRHHDPLSQLVFFVVPDGLLMERKPYEVLRQGDLKAVLRAVEGFGEQVAR